MPLGRTIDRRGLLSWLIGVTTAAIGGTVAVIFGRFLAGAAPAHETEEVSAVSLGKTPDAGERPIERTVSFVQRDGYYRETRRARVFLTRVGEETVVLSATCTHLGCAVTWDAGSLTFRCPCHGGVYRCDGSVQAGPPPRPLQRLPIQIRAGEVFVRGEDLA